MTKDGFIPAQIPVSRRVYAPRQRGDEGGKSTHTETKYRLNLWVDKETVEWFRAGGPGWHGRINEILTAYVHERKQREK